MKGLKKVARESGCGMKLYYSFEEQTVSSKQKNDSYFFVTTLIRENTEEDIKKAIQRWMTW